MEDSQTQQKNDDRNDLHKTLKCDHCEKMFVKKHHLRTHIESVHENNRAWKCYLCVKSFNRIEHLHYHVTHVHNLSITTKELKEIVSGNSMNMSIPTEDSANCQYCGTYFAHKSEIINHIADGCSFFQ